MFYSHKVFFLLLFTYHISVHFFFFSQCELMKYWHTCDLFVQSVGKENVIKTSEQHRSGKRGPTAFDVNTPVALGCLHASIGQTHVNNLLSSFNNPTLNSVTFKLREGQVGKSKLQRWKGVAKSTCNIIWL